MDRPLAEQIALALDDWEALAFLDELTARHRPELLRRALDLAKAVPESRLRTTRGAYFTGVVRALTRAEARRQVSSLTSRHPHA
ncbi:MAG: hypothetical protein IT379_14680 [Deltaproteobacteria bacterium]|nr:hypothetical protein [Deltaproteobacteria bacterium]